MPASPFLEAVGRRIALVRERRGLTQAQLAHAIGVSKATVAHYEHGRASFNVGRLFAIADALHCRPDVLLEPDRPMPRSRSDD